MQKRFSVSRYKWSTYYGSKDRSHDGPHPPHGYGSTDGDAAALGGEQLRGVEECCAEVCGGEELGRHVERHSDGGGDCRGVGGPLNIMQKSESCFLFQTNE